VSRSPKATPPRSARVRAVSASGLALRATCGRHLAYSAASFADWIHASAISNQST
jgi:hypothetical protein